MANTIKRSDISEEDVFKDIRDSARKTQTEIESLNEELIETAEILDKDISNAKFVDTASINKATKAFEKANKAKKQSIQLDEQKAKFVKIEKDAEIQLERVKREKLKTEREEVRNAQQLSREKERQAKAAEKAAKKLDDETNEYKKLTKATREQKNESKRLAAQLIKLEQGGKRNTKEFRQLKAEYKGVTKAAQQGDKALKKIDRTVGDNFRNVGNYTGAVSKLKGMLGQLGLAFGAFSILKGAGQTVVEFDSQVQNLVSITGAAGEDLDFFKNKAIELGTEVQGGASSVIEAYKLIGSAKPELLKNAGALNALTEQAILLSQASGLDLPDAATRLTDAMNQFGAPVEEAAQFVNTLANASLEGSAAIPDVTDALLKFGAIASESNVSVEESAALIEVLASKGLKGAEAGTALRNVMLKLSAPDALPKEAQQMMEKLGISFEDISDPSKSFAERLEAMKPILEDTAALQKVFGAENEVAAINLLKATDQAKELTEAMEDQSTAQEQANANTDTLAFAFNKLKESWNALVLEFSEGTGAATILKNTLLFIANNLTTIISVLGKAIVAWGIYKTAILATRGANFILSGGIKDTIKGMGQQIKALKKVGQGADKASKGIKATGNAMKAVPWVAVIGFVLELAASFWDAASGAKALREAQEAVEKIKAASEKKSSERAQNRSDQIQSTLAENERAFRKTEITEEELKRLNEEAIASTLARAEADKKAVGERTNQRQADLDDLKRWTKRWNGIVLSGGGLSDSQFADKIANLGFKNLAAEMRDGSVDGNEFNKMLKIVQGQIQAGWGKWKVYNEEVATYTEMMSEAETQTFEVNKNQQDLNKNLQATPRSMRKVNTEFSDLIDRMKELNDLYREQADLDNELREINVEVKVSMAEDDIEAELENQRRLAETTGEIQVDHLEDLIDRKAEIQRQAVVDQEEFLMNEEAKNFEERFNEMQRQLNLERAKLLAQAELTEDEKAKIEAGYAREQADLDALKIEEQKNLDKKLEIIHAESAEELKEIDRDVAEEKKDVNDELIQEQINFANQQAKNADDIAKKQLEADKKLASDRKAIAQAVTDFLVKKSDERIAQAEKEISAAETEFDRLQQLADEGNIKAEQSLAEQQQIINEANKKKIQEEQAKQRIELINAGLQTYNSKVEAGAENPLAETIRDIALLQQFLSTIPAFYEGTDTTVASALGAPQMSGRDGYVVRVDGQEKILNPTLSKMTGDMNTEQIAKVAQDYQTGKLIHAGEGAVQIGGLFDASSVVNKLDSLENTIKNSRTDYKFEQLADNLFSILKTERKGNTLIHNRYRKDT